jgi:hypothetical protein
MAALILELLVAMADLVAVADNSQPSQAEPAILQTSAHHKVIMGLPL